MDILFQLHSAIINIPSVMHNRIIDEIMAMYWDLPDLFKKFPLTMIHVDILRKCTQAREQLGSNRIALRAMPPVPGARPKRRTPGATMRIQEAEDKFKAYDIVAHFGRMRVRRMKKGK